VILADHLRPRGLGSMMVLIFCRQTLYVTLITDRPGQMNEQTARENHKLCIRTKRGPA
jgi:hypothetical protein